MWSKFRSQTDCWPTGFGALWNLYNIYVCCNKHWLNWLRIRPFSNKMYFNVVRKICRTVTCKIKILIILLQCVYFCIFYSCFYLFLIYFNFSRVYQKRCDAPLGRQQWGQQGQLTMLGQVCQISSENCLPFWIKILIGRDVHHHLMKWSDKCWIHFSICYLAKLKEKAVVFTMGLWLNYTQKPQVGVQIWQFINSCERHNVPT